MAVDILKTAHDKFMAGDHLEDEEVNMLYAHFNSLGGVLDDLFLPEYKLMQRDVWAKVDRLREIRQARKKR